jgi:CubicO group peptidase (beta-lactamase class C family)
LLTVAALLSATATLAAVPAASADPATGSSRAAGSGPGASAAAAPDARTAPLGAPLQVLLPEYRLGSFTHMAQILPARIVARGGPVRELPRAERAIGDVAYQRAGRRETLDAYLQRTKVMAFLVLADGRIVHESYRQGTDERTPFVSWSMAKSVVGVLAGVAQADGSIASIADPVTKYAPALAQSGYQDNSIRDLLQMSSGVKFVEDYAATDTIEARAWVEGTVTRTVPSYADTFLWFKERTAPPGTRFYYASIEPAIVGWLLTRATGRHLADYLSEKVWRRIGAEHDASWVLDRAGGLEIGSCCINATARDYARFALMIQDMGRVGDEQVVPEEWVRESTRPDPRRAFLAPENRLKGYPYGYQHYWWLWPREAGAVSALGVHGQQIMIDFDDRVVVVQTANWDHASDPEATADAQAMHAAIVAALRSARVNGKQR